MPIIDLGKLLKPVSDDAPCGDNLEYDPEFGELERAAQGVPERAMGEEIKAAEEPDWNDVLEKAEALFDRTKDLRVGVHLLQAGLRVDGLPAFASGIAVLRGLLNDYWDTVHPQLDKDDNDDPTLRLNTLLALNDRAGLIASLARTPLVRSRALGRVSLRDVRIAAGELKRPAEGEGPPPLEQTQIEAAFMDGELADLQANAEAVAKALADLAALGAHLAERVGIAQVPDLAALTGELRAIGSLLAAQLGRRGAASGNSNATVDGAVGVQGVAVGDIRNRDDVVRVLDRVCEYFQRNEPSSPVPLLLRRAQRLVAKDFIDILRDLTPDALAQAKLIGGLDQEE